LSDIARTARFPVQRAARVHQTLPDADPRLARRHAVASAEASGSTRASLAPNAEITVFPWRQPPELKPRSIDRVRGFLKAHAPNGVLRRYAPAAE